MTLDDLFDRASPEPMSGCWLWEGANKSTAYGRISYQGRNDYAHRVAVLLSGRTIPPGMEVDHLCRVRCCINPGHLEVVTAAENIRRGQTGQVHAQRMAALTHCNRGHPWTEANTYHSTRNGKPRRSCRACRTLTMEKYRV